MLDFLRIGRGDGEKLAVRQGGSFRAPPQMAVHCLRPGGNHPLDRDKRAPGAGDRDLQAPVDLFRGGIGPQRDLVHVDEMLAQRFEIDLRPIGFRPEACPWECLFYESLAVARRKDHWTSARQSVLCAKETS